MCGVSEQLRGPGVPDKGVGGAVVGTRRAVSLSVIGVERGCGRW